MSITVLTPTLGPMAPRLLFASLDEGRCAARAVIGRARHRITLASPDLEPALYGHPSVIAALTRFVLGPGYRQVRILQTRAAATVSLDHALMALSRKLSTSFDVRVLPQGRPDPGVSYLVADRDATLLRLDTGLASGMYALENPAAARTHLSHFECLWQTCATPDEHVIAV